MQTYIKFIISIFLKSFLYVSIVVFCLVFILNLLTEIEFFRQIDIESYMPIYISLLNSPTLLFEIFPFIFLLTTQLFFINLIKNEQILTFKYSGLKNSNIMMILTSTSLFLGVILIILFYNLSSNLKNIYLEIKNNYTEDDKYLAVITNNGLWIKDSLEGKTFIINASKLDNKYLIDTSVTVLDKDYNVEKHIQSEKINIESKSWTLINPLIYKGNNKITKDIEKIQSNFDFARIQSLFSNLSALSILELFNLRKNYKELNLSTTEINLQIQKILSFPIYLSLMTILSAIIMFNTKKIKSITIKISIGLFLAVMIYYINNFFNVLGKTEKIPIIFSIWIPIFFLTAVNSIFVIKINEK